MRCHRFGPAALRLLLVVSVLLAPSFAWAQQNAGVVVDAQGVLRKQVYTDPTGELSRERLEAAKATLSAEISRPSPLRKVSLKALEAAVAKQLSEQRRPTDEMLRLAGLTRVQYVFFYPETQDIVLAGPAEGWLTDLAGRPVGMVSGRPTLELEDLVVALRAYAPGAEGGQLIGCSIDPTPEGLANMQNFLASIGAHATPNDTEFIVEGLRTALGLQRVSIKGVSPATHFAQVMVEADYRMKLIGIGLERPPIKLASYVDRANPSSVSRNALQRWYFLPDYQCVRMSDDANALELVGDGVKLVGENELVTSDGERVTSGGQDRASQAFTIGFTQRYADLAAKIPVYGQLRNLIDLSVTAAFLQQQDLYGKADWRMETFGSEEKFAVETHTAPVEVETAVTSVWKGNRLMTPVGGGVHIEAEMALESTSLLEDPAGKVSEAHAAATPRKLADGRWWWD